MDSENTFLAFLPVSSELPVWELQFDINAPNLSENTYSIDVGMLVWFVIKRVNMIQFDGSMDFSEYNKILGNTFNKYQYMYSKAEWKNYSNNLLNIIKKRNKMTPQEKFRQYKIYRLFAFFLLNEGMDFEDWLDYTKELNTNEINYPMFNFSDAIIWKDNVLRNDILYRAYEIKGMEYLFMLDLWELLFNKNTSLEIKQCQHCGNYFKPSYGQMRYCDKCREPHQYKKIKNEEVKEDEAKRISKQIRDLLFKRYDNKKGTIEESIAHNEYTSFLNEDQYHKDVLKGKAVEKKDEYLEITTEEEYLSWLKDVHAQKQRKRGRKNGKTNETSKWDGSDNESIGQATETVPSDDNSGLE